MAATVNVYDFAATKSEIRCKLSESTNTCVTNTLFLYTRTTCAVIGDPPVIAEIHDSHPELFSAIAATLPVTPGTEGASAVPAPGSSVVS